MFSKEKHSKLYVENLIFIIMNQTNIKLASELVSPSYI